MQIYERGAHRRQRDEAIANFDISISFNMFLMEPNTALGLNTNYDINRATHQPVNYIGEKAPLFFAERKLQLHRMESRRLHLRKSGSTGI